MKGARLTTFPIVYHDLEERRRFISAAFLGKSPKRQCDICFPSAVDSYPHIDTHEFERFFGFAVKDCQFTDEYREQKLPL